MNPDMLLFGILVIVLWACAAGIGWLFWKARRDSDLEKVRARLLGVDNSPKPELRRGPALLEGVSGARGRIARRLLAKLQATDKLRLLIEQAGLKWDAARTVHASIALFLMGYLIVWRAAPWLPGAGWPAGGLCGCIPLLYIRRMRKRRLAKFEEQFADSLEFVARSMRAGHAFSVSLEMVQTEFPDPLGGEFRRTFEEQNLGMPLDAALDRLRLRVPVMDVRFFVSAVLLQKRTGGNLAELLDKLASLIRERFKLRGRIRAISAHGRMSGMALSLIPVGVGVLMCLVNRDYLRFFTEDGVGRIMLAACVGMQLIGYGIIARIVRIEE